MSCVQKIILTKVDAGQVAMRQITNLHLCKVKEPNKGPLLGRFSLKKINSNCNKNFCILSETEFSAGTLPTPIQDKVTDDSGLISRGDP